MYFSQDIENIVKQSENELYSVFKQFEDIEFHNQSRVLSAFQDNGIASRHFAASTGYGYDDIGRDAFDKVFADALCAKSALVRPQIVNGTHAIFTAIAGLLTPGDTLYSITGKPYDTLQTAIGVADNSHDYGRIGALREFGIVYKDTKLKSDGLVDIEEVKTQLKEDETIKVVFLQRSRGYEWREAISIEYMHDIFSQIKSIRNDVYIVVDNCYGEFTEFSEPCAVGASIIAGSLIKNPGGGIIPTGGYIAGEEAAVERISHRLTVPGMGAEVGSYALGYMPFFQGLFLAPHVTMQAVKAAELLAHVFENLGMKTLPHSGAKRSDIIQAVEFSNEAQLISFIQSIQRAAPIDSFVLPEPSYMPGYSDDVIMAAGTFIQGASIELSADAPVRSPYIAYVQGALTYAHGRIGVMTALKALIESGEIVLN